MPNSRQHKGYALLVLLLAVFVGGSSVLLGVTNNRHALASQTEQELFKQMFYAKEALLAYAANTHLLYQNAIGPGYLPCPDSDNSGKPDVVTGSEDNPNGLCHTSNTLGRLPQYVVLPDGSEFRFGNHNSGIDQQFWYAVSSENLRIDPTPNNRSLNKVNGTAPRLSLDGTSGYVALIIAPGEALGNQTRIGTGRLLYSNYLDGENGNSGSNFFSSFTGAPPDPDNLPEFNDRIIGITHNELMQYVGMSVAHKVKKNLDEDFSANGNDYPYCYINPPTRNCPWVELSYYSSFTSDPVDWLSNENWNAFSGLDWIFTPSFIIYLQQSRTLYFRNPPSDPPSIAFSGCNAMRFTLHHDGGIIRTGNSCQ